jgi:AcrR family transcriptional regulator
MATAALRVDAERNRRRILAAAGEVIARDGVHATVEAIAEAAGVGMGTLYRRFPTKEALVEAVLTDLIARMLANLAEVAAEPDPWTAFETSLHALGNWCAQNRGVLDTLQPEAQRWELFVHARANLLDALDPVLERAQAAGVVRRDVAVTDLLPLTGLLTKLPPRSRASAPQQWERFLAIALDGLRADGANPLPGKPLPRRLGS